MAVKDREALKKAHPDSWIPVEVGEELKGEIIDVVSAWSDVRDNGSFYPLLTIRQDSNDEELKVHCFGTVLYNEITRLKPEIGEQITIRYLGAGEQKKKGMNAPEIYKVRAPSRKNQAASVYAQIENQKNNPDDNISNDENGHEDIPF